MAQMVKNPPAMAKTQVRSLGQEDPLEKGMAYPLQYSCLENSTYKSSMAGYRQYEGKKSDTNEVTEHSAHA